MRGRETGTRPRAVSQAILRVGTKGTVTTLPPAVQQWCERVIQLPYHLGGFSITPLVQSGKAGFYSATAKFISWLATLPNADFWLPSQHDLTQPDAWECPRLATFRELHHQFCSEFKFTEWAPPADASGWCSSIKLNLSSPLDPPVPRTLGTTF